MDNPSIGEANKVLRVLNGVRLKYTVRVHLPSNQIIEWQSNEKPALDWVEDDRQLWICNGYGNLAMRFPDGAIILCEENPKV